MHTSLMLTGAAVPYRSYKTPGYTHSRRPLLPVHLYIRDNYIIGPLIREAKARSYAKRFAQALAQSFQEGIVLGQRRLIRLQLCFFW